MKRHFTVVLLMPVKPLATSQEPLKGHSSLCYVQVCIIPGGGRFEDLLYMVIFVSYE